MNWFTGTMVYVVVWWLVFFSLLPIGVRPPDRAEAGHVESAPEHPRLWLKAGAATLVAALIWAGIYYVIESDWISFRTG